MNDVQSLEVAELADSPDERPSRLARYGKRAGYSLFFLVALLISLVINFPNRQLKGFIESRARNAGYPLAIEELRIAGLGSIELTGVKLTLPVASAKPGVKPEQPSVLIIDEVSASAALWPLLKRRELDATFSLRAGDGTIEDGKIKLSQGASSISKRASKGKKSSKGKKPTVARRATLLDIDIPSIDRLDLEKLGLDRKALGFTTKVGGRLQGVLSGSVKLHWEGRPDGARGDLDLELTDAVLREPSVAIDSKGPPLELQDLRLGVVTLKVRIDEKGRINLLKSKRGVDSATAVHLAGVDVFGPDLELVAEERSHVVIPPGRTGLSRGRMQVHLVFALPKAAKGKSVKKLAKADNGQASRASWDLVRQMINDKYKRFMRSGYLGMTCSGSLTRPTCTPSLPQVTVGTRKQARSDARKKNVKNGVKKSAPSKSKSTPAAKSTRNKTTEATPVAPPEAAKDRPAPAPRLGTTAAPAVRTKKPQPLKGKASPKAKAKPSRGDSDDEEDGEEEDEDEKERRAPKRGDGEEQEKERGDDDEEEEEGESEKPKKKKASEKPAGEEEEEED